MPLESQLFTLAIFSLLVTSQKRSLGSSRARNRELIINALAAVAGQPAHLAVLFLHLRGDSFEQHHHLTRSL